MDWSDLTSAAGQVLGGHQITDVLDDRTARTLRLSDRRSGRLRVLVAEPGLVESLSGLSEPGDRSLQPIFGAGALDEERVYVIVPEAPRATLDDLVEEGPLEVTRVASILRRLARAYAALHAQGVVLLNLRPDDIGVRTTLNGDELTVPSHPALVGPAGGRPLAGYCAPEAERGAADARADQFSLGVIAYELLSGTTPHNPDAPPSERTIMPLSPVAGVPEGLFAILQRLLSDEPDGRYASMDDLLAAFALLDMQNTAPIYGHFTPVMPGTRDLTPRYLTDEGSELDEPDSILKFLLLLVAASTVAMALSAAVFLMW